VSDSGRQEDAPVAEVFDAAEPARSEGDPDESGLEDGGSAPREAAGTPVTPERQGGAEGDPAREDVFNALEVPWYDLRWLNIGLEQTCFFPCRMCDLGRMRPEPRPDAITQEEWKSFLRIFGGFTNGKAPIDFNCGEPFYRQADRVLELVSEAERWGVKSSLTSNGYLIDAEMAARICHSHLHSLRLSLDAVDPDLHDRLRGMSGSHERVLRALDLLLQRSDRPRQIDILTVIMEANLEQIVPLVRWVLDRHPGLRIAFQVISEPFGRAPDPEWRTRPENEGLWPRDPGRVAAVIDELLDIQVRTGRIRNPPQQLHLFKRYFRDPGRFVKNFTCKVGERSMFIEPNGDCRLCWIMPPIGNIRRQTLMDIWLSSPRTREVRRRMAACTINCHALLNCAFEQESREPEEAPQPPATIRGSRILLDGDADGWPVLNHGGALDIVLDVSAREPVREAFLRVVIQRANGDVVCANNTRRLGRRFDIPAGESELRIHLPDPGFDEGFYYLVVEIAPFENFTPDPRCQGTPRMRFEKRVPPGTAPGGKAFPFALSVRPATS
jgi:MoaA/NifB/PqqE/SkfB family radical SAM enzyme